MFLKINGLNNRYFTHTLAIFLLSFSCINYAAPPSKSIYDTLVSISLEPDSHYINTNLPNIKNQMENIEKAIPTISNNYWKVVNTLQTTLDLKYKVLDGIVQDNKEMIRLEGMLANFSKIAVDSESIAFYTTMSKTKNNISAHIGEAETLYFKLNVLTNKLATLEKQTNFYNLKIKNYSIGQYSYYNQHTDRIKNTTVSSQQTSLNQLTSKRFILGLGLALSCAFALYFMCYKWKSTQLYLHFQPFIPIIQFYVFPVFPLAWVSIYWHIWFYKIMPTPNIVWLIDVLLVYLFIRVITCVDAVLPNVEKIRPKVFFAISIMLGLLLVLYNYFILIFFISTINFPIQWGELRIISYCITVLILIIVFLTRNKHSTTENIALFFLYRLRRIALFFSIYILGIIIVNQFSVSPVLSLWIDTISITLFNLAWLWLNWLIFKTAFFTKHGILVRIFSKITLLIGYLLIIYAACQGYQHFAILVIPNLITSATLIMMVINLNQMLKIIYFKLTNQKNKLSKKFYQALDIGNNDKIIELVIIRYCLMSVPIVTAFLAVSELWGKTLYDVIMFYKTMKMGVPIFDIVIYPARIIRSGIAFCCIMLIGRYLAYKISRTSNLFSDKNIQRIIQTVIRYTIFCIAIIIALVIAGINTASLLVVTGGFSFGLAFGLKQFASDAGSGVYIMFDKPFQVNDYISLNNTEGFVKKIGLLSTQIISPKNADVIVPNSLILSGSIINYTFLNNKVYQMELTILVNDVKNIHKSQELLLKIASENSLVIKNKEHSPAVFLQGNQLTLEFEIEYITERKTIASELALAISQAFTAKKIAITFGSP